VNGWDGPFEWIDIPKKVAFLFAMHHDTRWPRPLKEHHFVLAIAYSIGVILKAGTPTYSQRSGAALLSGTAAGYCSKWTWSRSQHLGYRGSGLIPRPSHLWLQDSRLDPPSICIQRAVNLGGHRSDQGKVPVAGPFVPRSDPLLRHRALTAQTSQGLYTAREPSALSPHRSGL